MNFLWTVSCQAQQKVEDSSSFQSTRTKATLSMTKGVLTGGVTCKFNVTGTMNYNPSVKSSVAVDIKALPTPLEPAIVGGYRDLRLWFCLMLYLQTIENKMSPLLVLLLCSFPECLNSTIPSERCYSFNNPYYVFYSDLKIYSAKANPQQ